MGEVYKAKDTRLDRTVAIKVLPSHVSDDPALRERFDREARTIASLNHPHICTLHDVGHRDGTDYLVLEYLEGQTLADIQCGRLPTNSRKHHPARCRRRNEQLNLDVTNHCRRSGVRFG